MEPYSCTNLQKINTDLNADSVEWCPYRDLQNIVLCGTYKLQESAEQTEVADLNNHENQSDFEDTTGIEKDSKAQVRHGGVQVYKLNSDHKYAGRAILVECSRIDMCGVLDIKWPDVEGTDIAFYGLVDAEGFLQILSLERDHHTTAVMAKEKLSDSSLGLSLDWTGPSESQNAKVTASDSAGCVNVFSMSSNAVSKVSSWKAHDYEAWITAFSRSDNNIVFSGGDDCRLKGWDLRDTSYPVFCSKRHQMGVCSIQSHPFKEHLFATGSYDEELLVWDNRSMTQPLSSASLGGGIWRIKWDPFVGNFILTATMYNGTHIVGFSGGENPAMPILSQYDDHNLAYGADWCRLDPVSSPAVPDKTDAADSNTLNDVTKDYLISTCSFYDHSLHLWKWTNKC